MRSRSPANSADSSPPVPARISMKVLRTSSGSLGSSSRCNSLFQLRQLGFDGGDFLGGHFGHLGVFLHFAGLGQVGLALPEPLVQAGHLAHLGVFARERAEPVHVADHVRLREEEVQLIEADGIAVELLAEKGFHCWLEIGMRTDC